MSNTIEITLTNRDRQCGNCKDWFGERSVSILRGTVVFANNPYGICKNAALFGRQRKYSDTCLCHRRLNTDIDIYNYR